MATEGLMLYLLAWALISVITYFVYLIDKRRAIKNKFRIKESSMLLLAFLLGSLGALIGMYTLRHKTRHRYFVVVNWLSFMIHMAIAINLARLAF